MTYFIRIGCERSNVHCFNVPPVFWAVFQFEIIKGIIIYSIFDINCAAGLSGNIFPEPDGKNLTTGPLFDTG
jgi:hypothetical protein